MSNQPTRLTLSCLDVLLSQLSKDDSDLFKEKQRKETLSKIWIYNHHTEYEMIIYAENMDEAIYKVSKSSTFRESRILSTGRVSTSFSYRHEFENFTCICVVCSPNDYIPAKDHEIHKADELTDEAWFLLVKNELGEETLGLINLTDLNIIY